MQPGLAQPVTTSPLPRAAATPIVTPVLQALTYTGCLAFAEACPADFPGFPPSFILRSFVEVWDHSYQQPPPPAMAGGHQLRLSHHQRAHAHTWTKMAAKNPTSGGKQAEMLHVTSLFSGRVR